MDEAVYRSVKRICYAGLDSVRLRQAVVERIERAVAFDAYAFGTADPDTGLLTHVVAAGQPAGLFVAYSHWLYPLYAGLPTIDAARAGTTVIHLEAECPEIKDAMAAAGLTDAAHIVLHEGGALWGKLCLMRERAPLVATLCEQALLERIAPHVARGLRNAALIDEGNAAAGGPHAPGVLVLDARGRPTLRTPALAPLLADLADVGIAAPEGVPLAILNVVRAMRRRHAAAEAGDGPAGAFLRARGLSGRWYTIRASLAEPDERGEVAAVVVVRPVAAREIAPILTRLYGLSLREREIAAALARGESTKGMAARFGISPHTVKEHVDRACAKIGVSGRRALVARLYFDGQAARVPEPA